MATLESEPPYTHQETSTQPSELPPQVSPDGYGLGLDGSGYGDPSMGQSEHDVEMLSMAPRGSAEDDVYAGEPPYGSSVEQYAPQRALSNSKSYASRAKARPDLSLDTESPTAAYDARNAPTSATSRTKGASVSDRSPLQKLEMTLGDISKEEKRARVAEAEQAAQERANAKPTGTEFKTREMSQQRRQRDSTMTSTRDRGDSATNPRDSEMLSFPMRTPRYSASHPMHIPQRRGLGYDSALTGAAAAAALGAYQSHSRVQSGGSESISRDLPDVQPGRDERDIQPPRTQPSKQTRRVGFIEDQDRDQQGSEIATSSGQDRDVSQGAALGAGAAVLGTGAVVGTAAALGTNHSDEAPAQESDPQEQHRFSHLFHRGVYQSRQYQPGRYLDEWKGAQTAVLTEGDLNLASAGQDQAWWERDGANQQGQPSTARALDPDTQGRAYDHQAQQTTFQPKLFLKCGPLLRYTGIKKDSSSEGAGKEFWRGTVMIVTEDSSSSYDVPPTLRVFRQDKDAELAQVTLDEGGQQRPLDRFDPIAGHHIMSRTGTTLYVRSVHALPKLTDLSKNETDEGLFEQRTGTNNDSEEASNHNDGENAGLFREVRAIKLHAERGLTFWRFHVDVELVSQQSRIAYRINRGPTSSFWVPAKGQNMNVMFHSCNGFSLTVDSNHFCGPDPLWRDVLNSHQNSPFHCMIGGGDQIYNDAAMRETHFFQQWLAIKNPEHKHNEAFSAEMQEELESFYLHRYAMWFSQGLFSVAASQIPMVNVWDDHDIIDGFGSYPDHFMRSPVFSGLGAIAFKYYMLFQNQSIPDETMDTEPSWVLGAQPGPYIRQLSRNIFVSLGHNVSFLGLDCRTERKPDEILTQETWDIVFDRARREIVSGQTRHLLVLLGVPIAYPRMNFAENILTSRLMDPIKALGRTGMLGGFVNKFDGGVEVLDDLNDHWTAKHHKAERNWFIQELQDLAAEKNVRITILGGDVHLAAVGRFFTNKRQGVSKDRDHRYMPNIISSAIVNTPPPDSVADVLNKRNKIHHLDGDTDEDMVPLFTHDVDGKTRNNIHLLPRRNWCSFRDYEPGLTPPPTPPPEEPPRRRRSFSLSRSNSASRSDSLSRSGTEKRSLLRRFSTRKAPPSSYQAPTDASEGRPSSDGFERTSDDVRDSGEYDGSEKPEGRGRVPFVRSGSFRRLSASLTRRDSTKSTAARDTYVNLQGGLDVVFHCEAYPGDPAGITTPYRFLVPALFYSDDRGASYGERRDIAEPAVESSDRGLATSTAVAAGGAGAVAAVGATGLWRSAETYQADDDDEEIHTPVGVQPDSQGYADIQESVNRDLDTGAFKSTANVEPSSSPQESYKSALDTDLQKPENVEDAHVDTSTRAAYSSESARNDTSERFLRSLPRSEGPVETEVPYIGSDQRRSTGKGGRIVLERRTSASGPKPPSNIDELPASVQKRYSQFDHNPDEEEYSAPTQTSSVPTYGSARNSSYATPLTTPLLPASMNQLRSSQRRSIQSDYDRDLNTRSTSGGAAYESTNLTQDDSNIPQRAATYHAGSTSKAKKASTSAPFRSPLTSAPSNGFVSPPPEHREQLPVPQKVIKDPYGFYDDEESPPQQPAPRQPSKFERHYGGFDGSYDPMANKPKPFPTTYNKEGPLLPAPRPMIINPEKTQPVEYTQSGYGQTAELPPADSSHGAQRSAGYNQQYDDRYGDDYYDEGSSGGRFSGLIRRLTDSGERKRLRKSWK